MSVIETNTEAMKNDVGTISGHIAKLRSAAGEIEGVLTSLASSWEGDAATTYETLLKSDLETLRDLIDQVEALNQGTENAKTRYETCESNISDIIASITV